MPAFWSTILPAEPPSKPASCSTRLDWRCGPGPLRSIGCERTRNCFPNPAAAACRRWRLALGRDRLQGDWPEIADVGCGCFELGGDRKFIRDCFRTFLHSPEA